MLAAVTKQTEQERIPRGFAAAGAALDDGHQRVVGNLTFHVVHGQRVGALVPPQRLDAPFELDRIVIGGSSRCLGSELRAPLPRCDQFQWRGSGQRVFDRVAQQADEALHVVVRQGDKEFGHAEGGVGFLEQLQQVYSVLFLPHLVTNPLQGVLQGEFPAQFGDHVVRKGFRKARASHRQHPVSLAVGFDVNVRVPLRIFVLFQDHFRQRLFRSQGDGLGSGKGRGILDQGRCEREAFPATAPSRKRPIEGQILPGN